MNRVRAACKLAVVKCWWKGSPTEKSQTETLKRGHSFSVSKEKRDSHRPSWHPWAEVSGGHSGIRQEALSQRFCMHVPRYCLRTDTGDGAPSLQSDSLGKGTSLLASACFSLKWVCTPVRRLSDHPRHWGPQLSQDWLCQRSKATECFTSSLMISLMSQVKRSFVLEFWTHFV